MEFKQPGPSTSPLSARAERGEASGGGERHAVVVGARVTGRKKALARQMRKAPTPAEERAWELLRGRRLLGLKFRRQQVIRGFIVDFYCPALRLALEVDGAIHDRRRAADRERTRALGGSGVLVVRVRNEAVSAACLRALIEPHLARARL